MKNHTPRNTDIRVAIVGGCSASLWVASGLNLLLCEASKASAQQLNFLKFRSCSYSQKLINKIYIQYRSRRVDSIDPAGSKIALIIYFWCLVLYIPVRKCDSKNGMDLKFNICHIVVLVNCCSNRKYSNNLGACFIETGLVLA
jgi:hypothetical protein